MTNRQLGLLCIPLICVAIFLSLNLAANHAIFIVINQAFPSQALWMTITNTADFLFLSCALFIALHKRPILLTNALICALLIHLSVTFSKNFFAILRPEHSLVNIATLGPALGLHNYAMPSGHSASAFMAAIFIMRAYNLTGWKLSGVFFYAAMAGISRIAVGAHWPADIVAGAALGIILGSLCTHPGLNFRYRHIQVVNLVLCLPLILMAIYHITHIYDGLHFLNEIPIVIAGILALVYFSIDIKRMLSLQKNLRKYR